MGGGVIRAVGVEVRDVCNPSKYKLANVRMIVGHCRRRLPNIRLALAKHQLFLQFFVSA